MNTTRTIVLWEKEEPVFPEGPLLSPGEYIDYENHYATKTLTDAQGNCFQLVTRWILGSSYHRIAFYIRMTNNNVLIKERFVPYPHFETKKQGVRYLDLANALLLLAWKLK